MRKLSFVTKERLYRFSTIYERMALFQFLTKYANPKDIKEALEYFDVRLDTRYKCDGRYASVLSYKDENKRIRDVEVAIIDPHNGLILQSGDSRALVQRTEKQNSNSDYASYVSGYKCWSIAAQLAKGYSLQRQDTLFGLDKALEGSYYKKNYIVNETIDAVKMKAIFPYSTWVAIGKKNLLLNKDIAKVFQGRPVRLFTNIDDTQEKTLKIACILLEQGAKVEIGKYSNLPNLNTVGIDDSLNQPKVTISSLVFNLMDLGYSRDKIASLLRIEEYIPF